MWKLVVSDHFDAAHHLEGYPGKCARTHGHTWRVDVAVEGEKLDSMGMIIDFVTIKGKLKMILEELDHYDLNEVPNFTFNPTAENLAKWIYGMMRTSIPQVTSVTVWESPDASVTFSEEK